VLIGGQGGQVNTGSSSPQWHDSGTELNLTATPNDGYEFIGWSGLGAASYSGTNNPMTIAVRGPVTQTATFAAIPTRKIALGGNLEFGNVALGSTSKRLFTITNFGNSTLTVMDVSYPPGFSGNWTGPIAPGKTQEVMVTFSPDKAMSYNGIVTVNSDAMAGNNTLFVAGVGISLTNKILIVAVGEDLRVLMQYSTMPGFRYYVETATDLFSGHWSILAGSETNATDTSVTFTSPPGVVTERQRFYRVVSTQ
jgi:hypothetical protein